MDYRRSEIAVRIPVSQFELEAALFRAVSSSNRPARIHLLYTRAH